MRLQAETAALEAATVALGRAGIGVTSLVPRVASLEDLFFELTEPEAERA